MKTFSYPDHIDISGAREIESEPDFTFVVWDSLDKPKFDTRRKNESDEDPTKEQFTNGTGFIIEIHDSIVPELNRRVEEHLEVRHLSDLLDFDQVNFCFEHDVEVQTKSEVRRIRLRIRILFDPETAKKMTLEVLKYKKVGSLPNPKCYGKERTIPVNDVWKYGVDADAVNNQEECCGLPLHSAFFDLLHGNLENVDEPFHDLSCTYIDDVRKVADNFIDNVLFKMGGGFGVHPFIL